MGTAGSGDDHVYFVPYYILSAYKYLAYSKCWINTAEQTNPKKGATDVTQVSGNNWVEGGTIY